MCSSERPAYPARPCGLVGRLRVGESRQSVTFCEYLGTYARLALRSTQAEPTPTRDTGLLRSARLRANLAVVQHTVQPWGVQRVYEDMWIFTKPIQDLQAEDLESLITNRVREHVALEFKREMYGRSDADIREMLRDVSSIANAEGGTLIIGMEEDGDGVATALRPVPEAEVQAQRLIGSCTGSIAERIPGIQAVPVLIPGGHIIVVRIPRSYRRPHMVPFGGPTDFWVRHDRQKARMSIAEIRTAITSTEDLVMKLERFIEDRRSSLATRRLLAVMPTPLLLEEGRVDVLDDQVTRLLRQPPSYRTAAQGGVTLTDEARPRTIPTLRGVMAQDERSGRTVELYRNAHLEFRLADFNGIVEARQSGQSPLIYGWAVAELVRNFMHLLDALRDLTGHYRSLYGDTLRFSPRWLCHVRKRWTTPAHPRAGRAIHLERGRSSFSASDTGSVGRYS